MTAAEVRAAVVALVLCGSVSALAVAFPELLIILTTVGTLLGLVLGVHISGLIDDRRLRRAERER